MFRLLFLKLIIGVVAGAFAVGALFPILMVVPSFVGLGVLIFAFGTAIILSGTADQPRQAAGRCLVMLGAALVLMPILSITLGVLPTGSGADVSAKSDKLAGTPDTVIWQMFATFVAFGAGSIVSIAGLIVVLDGRNGPSHSARRRGANALSEGLSSKVLLAADTRRDGSPTQSMQAPEQTDPRTYSAASSNSARQRPDETLTRELTAGGQRLPSSAVKMRSEMVANSGLGLRTSRMSDTSRAVSNATPQGAAAGYAPKAGSSGARQPSATGMIPFTPIVPPRWRSATAGSAIAAGNGIGKQWPREAAQLHFPRPRTVSGRGGEGAAAKQDPHKQGTEKITGTLPLASPGVELGEIKDSKPAGSGPSSQNLNVSNTNGRQKVAESKPPENAILSTNGAGKLDALDKLTVVADPPASNLGVDLEDDKSGKPTDTGGKSAGRLIDMDRRRLFAEQIADLASSVPSPDTAENKATGAPSA